MGTEVAVESDPRLAGPGTVQAWEETGIAGSISRRLSSFPGLLDLCAAPLLQCVHSVSGEGSPSSPVMSAGLKLLGSIFYMTYAGFYAVFESLERPALLSLLRNTVLPFDVQDGPQAAHMGAFQLIQASPVQGPCLTTTEEAGENDRPVHLELR